MDKIMNDVFRSRIRVALYLRLSKEDDDKENPNQASESIKNQERLLREKAEKEGWYIVGVYCDENYSGADSTRPEFNRMLKDCELGKIDIVLCKNLSRFSRDVEIIERYIHGKFEEWNVRFVGLTDCSDTNIKENKKSRQINALTNQWYLEEVSENLRTTLRNKKKNGLFTGAFAPYGYQKDPTNNNHLIVDPVASKVVKEIFDLYNMGWGYAKIVKYLHDKKIPCPTDYKRKNGMKIPTSVRKEDLTENISKKGGYVISYHIENNNLKNFNDIYSINSLLINEKISSFDGITVTVRKLMPNTKFYVSTILDFQDVSDIDVSDGNWTELQIDNEFPKGTKCFIVKVESLRMSTNTGFELELMITSTSNDKKYSFKTKNSYDCLNTWIEYQPKFYWSTNTISEILKNEMYIGNLVQGKYKNVSYKIQKSKRVAKDNWIIIENTHEPIIDKKTWLETQNRRKQRTRSDYLTGQVNPLSKKVYCSVCGSTFEKTCGTGHKHEYMVCRDSRYFWEHCDNKNMIRYDLLNETILKEMNSLIENYKDDEILNKVSATIDDENIYAKKIATLKSEMKNLDEEEVKKERYFQQLYEDRVNQVITEEQFLTLSNVYKGDMEQIKERKKVIKEEIELLSLKESQQKSKDELFKQYCHIDTLTPAIVNEWIDKIVIGRKNTETGDREVKIIWNFNCA